MLNPLVVIIAAALALITGILIGIFLNEGFTPTSAVLATVGNVDAENKTQSFPQPYNSSVVILPRIDINSTDDVFSKRKALIEFIWKDSHGILPYSKMPFKVIKDVPIDDRFESLRGEADQIDQLQIVMEYGVTSNVFLFHPKNDIGSKQIVIYHSGHEGDFTYSANALRAFLNNGYSVMTFSMPLYGGNNQPVVYMEEFGTIKLSAHDSFKLIESEDFSPIKFFVEPITVALNYIADEYDYNATAMVGLSGGGWTTNLYAAIDPRISKSYAVAGVMPFHVYQENELTGDYEQSHPELFKTANHLEQFILSSYGENRSELLIYNERDPCCLPGKDRHLSYLPVIQDSVEKLGAGDFDIFIDDSARRHAISTVALQKILDDIKAVR